MIVVVPDYRHASPPPIVDGDRVKAPPPAELPPPTTLAERWPILACAAIVALAVLLGTLIR